MSPHVSPVRIAILMPVFRDISPVTHSSIIALLARLGREGIAWSYASVVGSSILPSARAELLSRFLDDPSATHALFVDADSGFDPTAVTRMVAAGVDVIGAPFARRSGKGHTVCGALPSPTEVVNGAVEVQGIGMGCTLISRATVEALIAAHPETVCDRDDGGKMWALFPTTPPPGRAAGAFFGEDIGFCHLVRGIGRKVWALENAETVHVGTIEHRFALADGRGASARPTTESDLQSLLRIAAMPNVHR